MIGTKIYKTDMSNYTDCAIWCNANNATIEDKGDYYEVVTLPLPTLEENKLAKIAELKAERDSKEVEPITYNGNRYDYDDKARERINAAIIALDVQGANAAIAWTTADNQDVSVTAADLRAIVAAVAVRSNLLHVAYRKAKARVEAAGSADEVNAVCME
ncbi:DUF4376 domain-containing protein [Phascolarctobacterium succinatutens]|uniref:DUF4376 domain-containing protein n=1 Tax=Phascolarctobacterium succinatutens TaxID=626940 RepID=UPI003D011269